MILLLRHGETQWNLQQRKQGILDSPLTERGKLQANQNAARLALFVQNQPVTFISSPLGRAAHTSKIIAKQLNYPAHAIQYDDRLKEYNYGEWAGYCDDEIPLKFATQWQQRLADKWHYQVPQGDSYQLLFKRAQQWLADIRDKRGLVIVVAHQMVNRTIRGAYLSLAPDQMMALSQHHSDMLLLRDQHETLL